jgi:hypothetical protein
MQFRFTPPKVTANKGFVAAGEEQLSSLVTNK